MPTEVRPLDLPPSALRAVATRLVAAGAPLRELGPRRRARSLARAAMVLRDPESALGRVARETLPSGTGLSPEMVQWGLETTLSTVDTETLLHLCMKAEAGAGGVAQPARLALVVLSSNLFTAPLRAIGIPLALGVPVLAKGSTRDDLFARLMWQALNEVDPEVGQGLELLTFAGGRDDLLEAAYAEADVVSVYGGDSTIAAINTRLPPTTRLLPHGHGVGAVFLPASSLETRAQARALASSVALDIAAYDQRGCLSPHWVWVEEGGAVAIDRFAELLFEALEAIGVRIPRGPLSTRDGALQMQWRGVSRARGTLLEGDGFSIALDPEGSPRVGPGARNVALLRCGGIRELIGALLPFGRHLKALGVAAEATTRLDLARALPSPLAPLVGPVGSMQTPRFDVPADGLPPWAGFVHSVGV